MGPGEESYRILHELQRKCCELNQKIDSLLRMMEMMTFYIQYSNAASEGNGAMDPNELQKLMNQAKNSGKEMTDNEFEAIFDSLKQGKSEEEIARMEQMVKLAKSFMK